MQITVPDPKPFFEAHKKPIYIVLGILILAFLGHSLYKIFYKPPIVKDIPVVRTTTVGQSSNANAYTYPGEVRGKYESNLAFQVGGKIISRSINLGDTVRAGQVLMTIDPKDVRQSYNLYQAAVNSAQSNYKLARDNAVRYETLFSKGAVSESIRDQYRTQYEAAAATLQQAEAQLIASSHQLEYTELRADHDGVISALSGEIGMVVSAGTPVATLVQAGDREIQIFVPEGRLNTIRPGQPCKVTFWALNNVTADGTITEIAPMADQATKTYKVRVALNAMPPEAKLGMTAKVQLSDGNSTDILIPRSAIYGTTGAPQVWVVKDGKVSLTTVAINGYKDDKVIITSGLKTGDIVVTAGITKLSNNMEVKIEGGGSK
ncbi:MAG: efflux RND transporter periplasmic adaptor subunit [Acidaminococcaceae bacterium]|jgi:multidrug efflux system membrane fusion protein|nr:efflux RND transporter periplasmic adaptor subunit [Acidaminococcaceae bacterium]MCI2110536.1 efflux RND transporter periplasmic adaptor subunit [Acidaminococcaceae bacterium]